MIGNSLSVSLRRGMMELNILMQDLESMIAAGENEKDISSASRKSIEPSSRLRQSNEVLEEDANIQFISDKLNDAVSKMVS